MTCSPRPPPSSSRPATPSASPGPSASAFVAALVPADAAARTTALSATLLALAAEGRIVEPVHRLLDLDSGTAWRDALRTLAATGASTGRAYAAAVGGAAARRR